MDWTQTAVTKPSHLRAEEDGGGRWWMLIEVRNGRERVEEAVCFLGSCVEHLKWKEVTRAKCLACLYTWEDTQTLQFEVFIYLFSLLYYIIYYIYIS